MMLSFNSCIIELTQMKGDRDKNDMIIYLKKILDNQIRISFRGGCLFWTQKQVKKPIL